MTSLAIGASVTLALSNNGFLEIATNGGLGSVTITPTGGAAVSESFGPSPFRKKYAGPYPEGASVLLSNSSAASMDYETDSTNLPASVQALVSGAGIGYGAMAIMGDSIAGASVAGSAGLYSTRSRGAPVICSSYLGHPWTFDPYNHHFAAFGTGWDAIRSSQLPAFLAAARTTQFAKVFISAGTNDSNAGKSFDAFIADALAVLSAIRATGAMPVMWGVLPRGTDGAMTVAKQTNQRVNEWLRQMSLTGLLEFVDCTEALADNSTAFGNALTSLMNDGPTPNLHPNAKGHYLIGKALADYYTAAGIRPRIRYATQQSDVFDRANNPWGVAFANANPLLQGGTTAPTGMTTSGGTWSKASRTLSNGQTRSDPQCVLAASTTHYLYDDWTTTGAWGATQLQPGDVIEAHALIDIASGVNLQSPVLRLSTNDGAANSEVRALNVDLTTETIPDGNHTLHLRTPRLTIPAYSGSGNASMFARLDVVTNAGASGTLTVRAFEVRRVA